MNGLTIREGFQPQMKISQGVWRDIPTIEREPMTPYELHPTYIFSEDAFGTRRYTDGRIEHLEDRQPKKEEPRLPRGFIELHGDKSGLPRVIEAKLIMRLEENKNEEAKGVHMDTVVTVYSVLNENFHTEDVVAESLDEILQKIRQAQ